ncbi:methyl-accepting chemotaxis protein [Duganella sp. FT109W]|uniref:Methyl-accepting chemotaxis protein n=1 Tax=Duganella margarita TaxID=2692170 RepID=A0ABW9WCQ6_9BURK|nr:methyl-accepting chemotaxis protein [Duganella margarita]MYN38090.1 methyl-accepting chemotaxis protein [Duganella margarita]
MLKSMKVSSKLIAGFICVAVLGALVAGIGIVSMGRINDMAETMYTDDLLGLSYIKEANINLIYVGRSRGNFLLATTEAERAGHRKDITNYLKVIDDYLARAAPLFVTPEAKKLLADYARETQQYRQLLGTALDRAEAEPLQQRSPELTQLLTNARSQANVLDDMLTAMTKIKEKRASDKAAETKALFRSSEMLMACLVIGSLVLGVGLGVLITRSLTRQLGGEPSYAAEVAGKIAGGDLTVDVALGQNDQSSVLFAMKHMRDSLGGIVGQVRSGTDTIATASAQIASGTQDLSSRTEEQAGALEETASSMEELTSTVRANADHARQANELARSASSVAQKGGAVVNEVIGTMSAINASSGKIADIIGVIDGIAFQTNILALNAAVEAARAGEQGRGFAVVASEVRTLAQRSATAAKEIKQLIDESVSKVGDGARQVDEAGVTMREIVASIQRVTDIMADIQAASGEQTTGIEQINQAIVQMDQVTQQNAALVEESAAASEAMQDQARKLAELVSVFRVAPGRSGTAAPAAPRLSPRPPVRVAAKPAPKLARPAPAKSVVKESASDWEEF